MTTRREKFFQVLVMGLTLLLGTFSAEFLSEDHVYPITVLLGPFVAGYLYVQLTKRSGRASPYSHALSLIGTVGLGVMGMILCNTLDDAKPHAWMVWCHDVLWGPLGDGVYGLLTLVLFVLVPVHCFMLGRMIGDARNEGTGVQG